MATTHAIFSPMSWRADWLKTASPEAILKYRLSEKARVRKWAQDNPERIRARKRGKRDPLKQAISNAKMTAKYKGYHSAAELARAQERKEETKSKRAAAKIESYKRKLVRNAIYLEKNRAKMDAYKAAWHEANKDRIKVKTQARYGEICAKNRSRRAIDPQYAITCRLRSRLRKALLAQGAMRAASTLELIGCSREQFCLHIEAQFADGMGWHNRSQWHLDHKTPCAAFDLNESGQQKLCFHFSNIQPLWKADNHRKGARF